MSEEAAPAALAAQLPTLMATTATGGAATTLRAAQAADETPTPTSPPTPAR